MKQQNLIQNIVYLQLFNKNGKDLVIVQMKVYLNLSVNQNISTLKKLQIIGWVFIFDGLVLKH